MQASRINEHIYLIDTETAGIRNFIASYVLKGKKAAVVETGPTSSIPNVLAGLKQLNVKPENVAYVAVSHVHLDHSGGVGTLLKHLPSAKVIVHPKGVPHLAHPEKLWEQSRIVLGSITELYGEPQPVPEDRIMGTTDGTILNLGNDLELRVVETLGHASHHQSYFEPLSHGVFPGDAAGIYLNEIGVVVPTTPPPLRLDIVLASLDRLVSLKPRSLYYSHFGKAADANIRLLNYAQQLKLWAKIAKQGIDGNEDVETTSRRIVESDPAFQKALEYVKMHRVLGETVLNHSIRGIIDFVKKFGTVPE